MIVLYYLEDREGWGGLSCSCSSYLNFNVLHFCSLTRFKVRFHRDQFLLSM